MSHRFVRVLLATALAAIVFALAAPAQELRGRVRGIVSDTTGAVIPAANVTLRNVNTNVDTVRQSNETGQYLFGHTAEVQCGEFHLPPRQTGQLQEVTNQPVHMHASRLNAMQVALANLVQRVPVVLHDDLAESVDAPQGGLQVM